MILTRYKTSKTYVGKYKLKDNIYFYKEVYKDSNEINNYNKIKDYYKCSNIGMCLDNLYLFDYISDFENKKLHDYLYEDNSEYDINIFKGYSKSLNNTIIKTKEENLSNNKHFKKSIITLKNIEIKYNYLIIDNKKFNLRRILSLTINKINEDKELYGFISPGNPIDLNITSTGYYTDFEYSGYNSIIGEIAIFLNSILFHDSYLVSKYNNDRKFNVVYEIKDKDIYIKSYNLNINEKTKKVLNDFVNVFTSNTLYKENYKYLKYYIITSIISSLEFNDLKENDKVTVLFLVCLMYNNIRSLNDFKNI